MWIGLIMVVALVSLGIKFSGKPSRSFSDEKALKIAQKTLDVDGIEHYELTSITSMEDTNITTVIVDTGSVQIALEIDQESGKVLHKEKLVR